MRMSPYCIGVYLSKTVLRGRNALRNGCSSDVILVVHVDVAIVANARKPCVHFVPPWCASATLGDTCLFGNSPKLHAPPNAPARAPSHPTLEGLRRTLGSRPRVTA